MRVTIDWLRDYVDISETPEEVAEALVFSGTNVEEVLRHGSEDVLDLEITTNRPDCQGVLGVAREVAVVYDRPLRLPSLEVALSGAPVGESVSVEVLDADLCPRYTARLVRGVTVGPSPEWLRRRLEAVGVRSVSNVVDVSNYVMLEWCQPLHFFDLANVRDAKIIVRRARAGETITAIDGREYELDPERLVIADPGGAVAIAGVMGGEASEVSGATTDILIEAARFDPLSVRATSRATGLATESSYRFERFVDHEAVDAASLRAACLLAEIAGGAVAPGLVDVTTAPPPRGPVTLRWARIARVLGAEVPRETCRRLFTGLGLAVDAEDDASITVTPPSWRSDLTREADLIEEVARLHGFGSIPAETRMPVRALDVDAAERTFERARSFLVGAGLHEVVTLGLVCEGRRTDPSPWTDREPLRVRNPVRDGEDRLRRSLLGSLVAIGDLNRDRGRDGIRLFEVASIYLPLEDDAQPVERTMAGILVEDDLAGVKGLVEALLAALGAREGLAVAVDDGGGLFRPGGGARISVGDRVVARLGELHPELARDEAAPIALAEVDLDAFVVEGETEEVRTVRPSRFPEVRRDLSVIVGEEVTWDRLRAVVDGTGTADLCEVRFFDLYRGRQVGPGRKSLAFSLVFRSDDRTLTGEEVDGRVAGIVAALARETAATLRTGESE